MQTQLSEELISKELIYFSLCPNCTSNIVKEHLDEFSLLWVLPNYLRQQS